MQTDVTPDSQMPNILAIANQPIYKCVKCETLYITHQHYNNQELCIDCSGSRHSYDPIRRAEMQRGYHAKRKERVNET